jgi:hypothetical protein
MFMAGLNNLNFWATDIGNAYLEAAEKLYIIAVPELGEMEGHELAISKALYGLQSSGSQWHDRLLTVCLNLGSSHVKHNLTSGCGNQRIQINTYQCMLMT